MGRFRKLSIIISIGMLSFVTGCGSDNSKDNRGDPSESDPLYGHRFGDDAFRCDDTAAQLTAEGPTYSADIEPVIKASCVSCHVKDGTSPDLSSFDLLKLASANSLDQLTQGLMPPAGALPAESVTLFKNWIDGGMLLAPEGAFVGEPKATARCGTVPASK